MDKKRFNTEYLRAIFETLETPDGAPSVREVARRIGVDHSTVLRWLRGSVPTKANLAKLVEVLEDDYGVEVDPELFLSDPFDLLYSQAMTFAYKIFLQERAGRYEVKITLSSIVRLLEALQVFQEPPIDLSTLPESALQQALPFLEEQAKAQAQLHIESLVAENKKVLLLRIRKTSSETLCKIIRMRSGRFSTRRVNKKKHDV